MHDDLETPAPRRSASTEQVPLEQRIAYWRDLVRSAFVALDYELDGHAPFFGEITFTKLAGLTVGTIHSNSPAVRRTVDDLRHDREWHHLVLLQRLGGSTARQDGRSAALGPGDFILLDTSRPFELRFDEHAHDITLLRLPCAVLDAQLGNIDELTATTMGAQTAAGRLLGSMVAMVGRDDAPPLEPSAALSAAAAIASTVAAALKGLPNAQALQHGALPIYRVNTGVNTGINRALDDSDDDDDHRCEEPRPLWPLGDVARRGSVPATATL